MADENKVSEVNEQNTEQVNQNPAETQEEISMESLMTETAKLKAELAKNKAALDKALHNNGELNKQLRARMTASEQEEEAKRIAEEARQKELEDLKNFKRKAEAKDRYATLGMSAEFAKEAAEAEVAGDMDALTDVYKRYQDATLKAAKDEIYRSMPVPEGGHDENKDEKDPFLAGFNDYQ